MGGFVHKTHRFAYQNEYKSPASRPGFGIFSLLVSCRHPTLAILFRCELIALDD